MLRCRGMQIMELRSDSGYPRSSLDHKRDVVEMATNAIETSFGRPEISGSVCSNSIRQWGTVYFRGVMVGCALGSSWVDVRGTSFEWNERGPRRRAESFLTREQWAVSYWLGLCSPNTHKIKSSLIYFNVCLPHHWVFSPQQCQTRSKYASRIYCIF